MIKDREMLSQVDLLELAEKEAGRKLTKTEEWFVWTHPSMTFVQIKKMLNSEETEKNLPSWPRFG